MARGKSIHAATLGEQVRDVDDRPANGRQRLAAAGDEKNRQQTRVETPRADHEGVERPDDIGDAAMDGGRRIEPQALDRSAACLARIDFEFSARRRSVAVSSTERGAL